MKVHHGLSFEAQDEMEWDRWRELAVQAVGMEEMLVQRHTVAVALGISKALQG